MPSSAVSKDIIQLIQEDHDRVRTLWRQYRLPGTMAAQRRLLALDIVRQSCIHSRREDMVLCPALAAHVGGAASCAMAGQHQDLEARLAALAATPAHDPNHDAMLQEYMLALEGHLREEEEALLPQLAAAAAGSARPDLLLQLGRQFEWAKLLAPSRPRPWSPKAPPLCYLANALCYLAFEGAPPL